VKNHCDIFRVFIMVKSFVAAVLGMIGMVLPSIVHACSVCFSGDDDAVTNAFNWSVFFLLAAPYTIAGSIGLCLVIAYRRAVAKRLAEDAAAQTQPMMPMAWNPEESGR
jgi:hypothetical protein